MYTVCAYVNLGGGFEKLGWLTVHRTSTDTNKIRGRPVEVENEAVAEIRMV